MLLEASSALLDELAGLDDPVLFETTAQEPIIYRLAETLGTVPPYRSSCPRWLSRSWPTVRSRATALGFRASHRRSGENRRGRTCRHRRFRSGFRRRAGPFRASERAEERGGIRYNPVVIIQGGSVLRLTVLSAFLRSAAMLLAVTVFVSSVSAVSFFVSKTAVPGCLILLALGFVPSIPQYFSETFILHDVVPLLPTTYLYVAPVAGWPTYLNLMDVLPAQGATWGLGMCILLGVSAALLFVAGVMCAFVRRGRESDGEGFACSCLRTSR